MEEYKIDSISYSMGMINCFVEMVACGVKELALSPPIDPDECELIQLLSQGIVSGFGIKSYLEKSLIITDLQSEEFTKGKYSVLYYKTDDVLEKYLNLKKQKSVLIENGNYYGENRKNIGRALGHMLSYPDEVIEERVNATEAVTPCTIVSHSNDKTDKTEHMAEHNKLDVCSQISFLYFDDLQNAKTFFGETLGFEVACDQGYDYCCIFKVSKSSFIGVVDRNRGAVKATSRDGVLTSLVVKDADTVYENVKKMNFENLSPLHISKELNIKSMMFTGPEGYRFEVEEFLDPSAVKQFYDEQ